MTANDNDFWLKSGIRNTFSYQILDSFNLLPASDFTLDSSNVESCTITESYESDTRISGTLELKGERPPEGCAIRINHTATLGDETQTETLGTFMIGSDSPKFMFGEYSGRLNLVSMLDRFSSDYAPADTAVSGQNACKWFENTVTDALDGTANMTRVNEHLSRTSKMSDWVWEFGTSVLSALFACAEKANARVSVDAEGHVTLNQYLVPSSITPTYTVDGNTLEAGIERTDGDRINRVVVKYQPKNDGETQFGVAALPMGHIWSYRQIKRWLTKTYEVNQGEEDADTDAQTLANYYLSLNDSTTHKWEGSGLYRPLSCGEVGTLSYQDTATGTPITHKVLLRQKEYTLDAAMETKYIFSQLD